MFISDFAIKRPIITVTAMVALVGRKTSIREPNFITP